MSKIHILPLHEAQKIAAGEIVERPASVVKELIENALDAGATHITIQIEDGGKKLIRIVDNGSGMNYQDAHLCTAMHATSKIRSIDDLKALHTFGFRGEALAALAASSQMTIITKQADTHEGIHIIIQEGIHKITEPIAAQTGTIIEIRDLFCTMPARQKFLKKRETEMGHIKQLIDAIALVHPQVHITVYADAVLIHNYLPTDNLYERTANILQAKAHNYTLVSCTKELDQMHLTCFVSDHHYSRYDRTGIMMFANKRWIKNIHLSRAIARAYMNVLPEGRFPVAIVMLDIPGTELDINVHPRKEEVQFVHPRTIEQWVHDSIKETLNTQISHLLQKTPQNSSFPVYKENTISMIPPMQPSYTASYFYQKSSQEPSISILSPALSITPSPNTYPHTNGQSEIDPLPQEYEIIGQLHKTYILVHHAEGLLMVDQHAAHECILYSKFEHAVDHNAPIQLLFPEIIQLTEAEIALLEPYLYIFKENGIIIEHFGQTNLRVNALPACNKQTSTEELIRTILNVLQEYKALTDDELSVLLHKKLRAQMACKAAIKAGDILDMQQMKLLLHDLYATKDHLTCPHGRPTCWLISLYEIEKKFKRKM
ncbi:MAG TPA: DNA mismatch repair endonuclease MutL [Candidatus Babeliales bacterium]|jgi:DNA mismatch repair protein MutL|nr:DNA mismatch repair endonuclease MutL [Candidatus Babeliales bacterium]